MIKLGWSCPKNIFVTWATGKLLHKEQLKTPAVCLRRQQADLRHGYSILMVLKPFKNLQRVIIMGYERDPLDKGIARSASFA
jgi:hypothetical protein